MYLDLDFTLLEMNPFTLDQAGKPFPLDMRGELDDTAAFRRWVGGWGWGRGLQGWWGWQWRWWRVCVVVVVVCLCVWLGATHS